MILAILAILVALLSITVASLYLSPELRAPLFKKIIKMEAERLEAEEVKSLEKQAGLSGFIDTENLMKEKNELSEASLADKLKSL